MTLCRNFYGKMHAFVMARTDILLGYFLINIEINLSWILGIKFNLFSSLIKKISGNCLFFTALFYVQPSIINKLSMIFPAKIMEKCLKIQVYIMILFVRWTLTITEGFTHIFPLFIYLNSMNTKNILEHWLTFSNYFWYFFRINL